MSATLAVRMTLAAIALGAATSAAAQQSYAYPTAGQSEAQQSKDRFECHQWAVTQSGFDPSTAVPLPPRPAAPPPVAGGYSDQPRSSGGSILGIGNGGMFQGGGMMGDAATGAALGAAGGAIAGDAGQGAAIGAVASTLFGALSRSSQQSSPPPQQQAASQDYYYQHDAADRVQPCLRRVHERAQLHGAVRPARSAQRSNVCMVLKCGWSAPAIHSNTTDSALATSTPDWRKRSSAFW
jgi:hypothetical protein